jgi:hypothetical protein
MPAQILIIWEAGSGCSDTHHNENLDPDPQWSQNSGNPDAQNGTNGVPRTLRIEARMLKMELCRPVVADLHHFAEGRDADPNAHHSKKRNLDRSKAEPQACLPVAETDMFRLSLKLAGRWPNGANSSGLRSTYT